MSDDYRAKLGEQRRGLPKCRHPRADRTRLPNGDSMCCRCEHVIPKALSDRGRRARRRGNDRELEIARQLGGEKVGMYGGPEDVRLPLLNVQSKVRRGAAFPYWMVVELDRLPRSGGRLPALVVTDAPGQGHERQSIVVMHLADFTDLHGRVDE